MLRPKAKRFRGAASPFFTKNWQADDLGAMDRLHFMIGEPPNFESSVDTLSSHPDYRVLRRLVPIESLYSGPP